MASLRKKYQGLVVDNSREPVATAPTEELAKPPEPVADAPQPAEVIAKTESNPVEDAAKSELLKRVREAERAAEFAQQQAQQQPPQEQFAEPEPETPPDHSRGQAPMEDPREQFEQSLAHLPQRVRNWYRVDPQYLEERAAQVQYAHHVIRRELGEEFTEPYYDRMDHALGVRNVAPQPDLSQPERPRPSAPSDHSRGQAVRPRYNGAPVSAPPSRETASMSTGRAVNERTPLTREELEIARASRISPEEYQKQKQKMLRLKAAGVIQDGGG